jgi:hypothetical protein
LKMVYKRSVFPEKRGLMQFTCRHSSYDKMYNVNLGHTCFQIRLTGGTGLTFFDRIWRHLSSATKDHLSRVTSPYKQGAALHVRDKRPSINGTVLNGVYAL